MKILSFVFLLFISFILPAGELADRDKIVKAVWADFEKADFEQLNHTGSAYLGNQSRTSSGVWKLSLYYSALSRVANKKETDPQYWTDLKNKVLRWSELDNGLSFAHMTYVHVLTDEAWMHRGGGYARDVPKEAWKPFKEKISEARIYLEKHKHLSDIDPHWYEQMIIIAMAQGWRKDAFYELMDEALLKHPKFYEIYFKAIGYLLPKWRGSVAEIEKFADYATKKSRAHEGNGMYARIYWYASQIEFGHKLFTKSNARWKQMKKGIDDVLKHYPDQWNINNFAVFSCLARDKQMTKKLMDMMQGEPIMTAWKKDELYTYCDKWTKKKRVASK